MSGLVAKNLELETEQHSQSVIGEIIDITPENEEDAKNSLEENSSKNSQKSSPVGSS